MTSALATMSSRELANTLEPLLPQLNHKDRSFGFGVITSTRRWGGTEGRDKAMRELIERATGTAPPAPEPERTRLGDFAGVYALLTTAKVKLQWPKIRLQLPSGGKLVVAFCGPKSQYVGQINVTDGGGFGSKWFGRVSTTGVWTKSAKIGPDVAHQVEDLLRKLASAPATTASEYGRLTGRCCFCNLPLSDEQSTAAGYGPKCAENYGLSAERKSATPVLQHVAAQEHAA